ncbi:MAG: DMT family transporter [Synergistales bacterium]|nr:DMT family transporter [Synergistales bacterium]
MARPENKVIFADLAMLFIAIFWGSGYGVSHMLLRHMTPLWLISFRFFFSSILVMMVFRKRLTLLTRKDMFLACLGGVILSGVFISHILGLAITTPGKQSFIQCVHVVMVPVFYALFYRRSPGLLNLLGAVITTAGLLVMAFTPDMSFNAGDLLSLVLALFIALHVLAVGNFCRRMDPLGLGVVQFLSASFIIIIFALISEPLPKMGDLTFNFWVGFSYVVVMVTVIPFLIQPMAQRYSPDTHAAILMATEGLWGYFIAVVMGEETLNSQVLLGGIVIFIGVMLVESQMFLRRNIEEKDLNIDKM